MGLSDMCILSFLPTGTPVDIDGLLNGCINNPDGHGWAIADDDRMYMGRSLDAVEALDKFAEVRAKHMNGPALFHSRYATHGSIRVANTHPFIVGGSHKTVVAHNGILPSNAHPRKGDDRSDTRIFADEILPRQFRRLDKRGAFNALTQWAGKGNKLVILTVDPRYRHNAYLVNEAAGHWDKQTGIWHSNYDYCERWYSYKGYSSNSCATPARSTADVDLPDMCLYCGYGTVSAMGYCTECRSCQDCCEDLADCLCYVTDTPALSVCQT